jgi:calcineurin-like phosphoesterase family protein
METNVEAVPRLKEGNDYTAFIGDPHGCAQELKELVDQINGKYPNTRIILLGDFLDRGYDVPGCLKYRFESVLGNHDHRFLKWLKTKDTTVHYYQPYYSEISEEDIAYLRSLPYYIEMEDVICIHAGIVPYLPMTRQEPQNMMYLRYTDNNRRTISLKKINKFGKQNLGAKYWTEFGDGSFGHPLAQNAKNVIYGHHVHDMENPQITKFNNGKACYGIDCGVVFGGHLVSAIIPRNATNDGHDWDKIEFLKVKAKQTYFQSDFTVR